MINGVVVMKMIVLASVLFAVSGCSKEEGNDDKQWQNYVSRYSHTYCDLRFHCDTNFEEEFGSEEQCKKEVLTNENKGRERRLENGCEFDPGEADFCLSAASEISCEDWLAGQLEIQCAAVWSCD